MQVVAVAINIFTAHASRLGRATLCYQGYSIKGFEAQATVADGEPWQQKCISNKHAHCQVTIGHKHL